MIFYHSNKLICSFYNFYLFLTLEFYMNFTEVKDINLHVRFYEHFLPTELADWMFYNILAVVGLEKRRTSLIVGKAYSRYQLYDDNIKYLEWTDIPGMQTLKESIEILTRQEYNVCAIQCYPSGRIGIGRHRDRELKAGSIICGLSLGQMRTIEFHSNSPLVKQSTYYCNLSHGSVYMMLPYTNDYWTHSILKDDTTYPRISCTFRYT